MRESSSSFRKGLEVPLAGLKLIRKVRGCLALTFFPFLIYFFLFVLGLYLSGPWVAVLIAQMTVWIAGWGIVAGFLTAALGILAWALVVMALSYVIFLIARVIAAPFHGLMAERILRHTGALDEEGAGLLQWARLTAKMTLITIAESVVFLLLGIVLFLLSFVPGLNLVAGFTILLIMAFDSADYSFEVLGFGLRRRFKFFFMHFWFFAGLATAMGVTLLIPFLNFVLFPAAIAGSAGALRGLLAQGDMGDDSRSSSQKNFITPI